MDGLMTALGLDVGWNWQWQRQTGDTGKRREPGPGISVLREVLVTCRGCCCEVEGQVTWTFRGRLFLPGRSGRQAARPAPSPGCLTSCLALGCLTTQAPFQWKRLRDRGPVSPGIPAPVLTLASRASMTLPHASVPLAQGVLRS